MADHYFSAEPASAEQRRQVSLTLAGRPVHVHTAAGVFSPDRIDLGTRVLLRYVPAPPQRGDLLDLGCGWGPLALTLGILAPGADVWGVDVNERALDLLRANALTLGLPGVHARRPQDVPAGTRFAAIWSNPPIRVGKSGLHELLLRWLPLLEPGGQAHLVVQRNLGADSLHPWLARELPAHEVTRVGSAKGYRVLRLTAPLTPPLQPTSSTG